MPNTNFQTFHQMGQAINEVVRQATGRDAVQNIDMDHVTVAQNRYYEEVTASGRMVSFTDRVGNTPLEKCVVQIEPVQAGSGDPSPSNVRPITGWTGVNIHVSPTTDAQDGTTYSIAFPSEAGTVYGGTLTVNSDGSGTLVVDKIAIKFDGSLDENWVVDGNNTANGKRFYIERVINTTPVANNNTQTSMKSNIFISRTANETWGGIIGISQSMGGSTLQVMPVGLTAVTEFRTFLTEHNLEVMYELATSIAYTLSTEQIKTLQGTNNIWADTGNIEVTYKELKELY